MFYEVTILGQNNMLEQKKVELVGTPEPLVVVEDNKEEVVENDAVLAEIVRLQAELEALKAAEPKGATKENNVKKNHKASTGDPNRTYVRLGKLNTYGKVPQQQLDIAAIMEESMEIGAPWTEEELFDLLQSSKHEYESLRNSKQDVTYLFRYYRGLDKKDGKHFGYTKRGFIRQNDNNVA